MTSRLGSSRLIASAVLLLSSGVLAQDAHDLMRQSDKRHRLTSEQRKATLTLQTEQGDQRVLNLEDIRVREEGGTDKLRLKFTDPSDIRGTALLNVSKRGAEAEQWLYLPSFRK